MGDKTVRRLSEHREIMHNKTVSCVGSGEEWFVPRVQIPSHPLPFRKREVLQKAEHACTSPEDFFFRPSRFTFCLKLHRDPLCYYPTRSFSGRKPIWRYESLPVSVCILAA